MNEYWGYVALLLPLLIAGAGLMLRGRLKGEALRVVGAVYRVSLHEAASYQDMGLAWLLSDKGVAFRKGLILSAYERMPQFLRAFITSDAFCGSVETAFKEIVLLSDVLELPSNVV